MEGSGILLFLRVFPLVPLLIGETELEVFVKEEETTRLVDEGGAATLVCTLCLVSNDSTNCQR